MSDIFDFADVDPTSLESAGTSLFNSGTDLFSGGPDLSGIFSNADPSFGGLFMGVTPPQSLPMSGVGGFSGMLGDLGNFVTRIYAGDAQLTAARSQADLARARAANQLETVKTTPNIWLVLGIGAAGVFALNVMDRQK